MKLSFVIPVKDEEENILLLFDEIREVMSQLREHTFEIIVVDDGSRDKTWEKVVGCNPDFDLKAYQFQFNCGKASALAQGFSHAQGDVVFTMDGDLQDNPKEIPNFLKKLDEGFDLVSGWKKKRHDPWHKTLPSKLFNAVVSKVAGIRLHDFNCGFKAYKKSVIQNLNLYGDFHRYIPVIAKWHSFEVCEIPVEHRPRVHGVSKYGMSRLLSGFLDLLTLVFIHKYNKKPLHFFGAIGMIFGLLGFLILSYFGMYWLIHQKLHVRPLLILGGVSSIMGIQFISLGLLAEMIISKENHKYFPVKQSFQSDDTHE